MLERHSTETPPPPSSPPPSSFPRADGKTRGIRRRAPLGRLSPGGPAAASSSRRTASRRRSSVAAVTAMAAAAAAAAAVLTCASSSVALRSSPAAPVVGVGSRIGTRFAERNGRRRPRRFAPPAAAFSSFLRPSVPPSSLSLPPCSRLFASSSSAEGRDRLRSVPYDEDVDRTLLISGYKRPTVNWYPGHIAKAERMLSETLKSVDVVVEVRDARIPKATAHPRVAEWSAGRPRVVVLTKVDTVPTASRNAWRDSYEAFGAGRWDGEVDAQARNRAVQAFDERGKYAPQGGGKSGGRRERSVSEVSDVLFVDAKRGSGIHSIHRAILRAGSHVNERRARRNLSERPLRVGIIGYPNVGKSALINRILGRKRARTANTPGVTRSLQWIRVRTDMTFKKSKAKEFELLDSPGIIPANMLDQSDALLLAACNSVGSGAYDNQAVAAYLCEWIKTLHLMGKGDVTSPQFRSKCSERYGFDPLDLNEDGRLPTGEDMLFAVADNACRGDPENAARKILQDFRSGRLGPIALQLAPESSSDEGQTKVDVRRGVTSLGEGGGTAAGDANREERTREREEERERRAQAAMETAREKGLELPPMLMKDGGGEGEAGDDDSDDGGTRDRDSAPSSVEEEVGKGLFDGW